MHVIGCYFFSLSASPAYVTVNAGRHMFVHTHALIRKKNSLIVDYGTRILEREKKYATLIVSSCTLLQCGLLCVGLSRQTACSKCMQWATLFRNVARALHSGYDSPIPSRHARLGRNDVGSRCRVVFVSPLSSVVAGVKMCMSGIRNIASTTTQRNETQRMTAAICASSVGFFRIGWLSASVPTVSARTMNRTAARN